MDKKTFIVIGVVVLLIGAAYFISKKSSTNKNRAYWVNNIYSHVIDNPTSADYQKLIAYDDGYLQAWSNAVDSAEKTFMYNGKTLSTVTGSTVK